VGGRWRCGRSTRGGTTASPPEARRSDAAFVEGKVRVWDGEALTLLHDLHTGASTINRLWAFKSAEGPTRLLVGLDRGRGLQVWDPEEGRLLHDDINLAFPTRICHLLESAQGRHLLAMTGSGFNHPRHPGDTLRDFLDVWDLGEAPAGERPLRAAHKHG
jgi:hypothetical protein